MMPKCLGKKQSL